MKRPNPNEPDDRFVINAVLVGKQKRPNWRAKNISQGFKDGTAKFRFEGPKAHTLRYFTVNIVAPTTAEGVTYRCPITISSEGDHSAEDTVLAGVPIKKDSMIHVLYGAANHDPRRNPDPGAFDILRGPRAYRTCSGWRSRPTSTWCWRARCYAPAIGCKSARSFSRRRAGRC